jgi:hypothetical protein
MSWMQMDRVEVHLHNLTHTPNEVHDNSMLMEVVIVTILMIKVGIAYNLAQPMSEHEVNRNQTYEQEVNTLKMEDRFSSLVRSQLNLINSSESVV